MRRFGRSTIQAEEKQFFFSMQQYDDARPRIYHFTPSFFSFLLKEIKITEVTRNLSKLFGPKVFVKQALCLAKSHPTCGPQCPRASNVNVDPEAQEFFRTEGRGVLC